MPGIIRDPIHNKNDEGQYGVIQVNDKLYLYDKEADPHLRFLPAGWYCDISSLHEEIKINPVIWGGITIDRKLVGFGQDLRIKDQGKVVLMNFRKEGGPAGRLATMILSGVNMLNIDIKKESLYPI